MTTQKTADNIPYFEDEKSKLHPGEPIVERNVVHAIIFDPKTDSVLCLDWPKFDWHTVIIGGIEGDEDPIEAAKREIAEETGYIDIQFIREVGKTRSGFYAAHKNENRIANATGILFELVSDKQKETSASETQHHNYKWIPKNEAESYLNLESQKYIWRKALESI